MSICPFALTGNHIPVRPRQYTSWAKFKKEMKRRLNAAGSGCMIAVALLIIAIVMAGVYVVWKVFIAMLTPE